MRCCQSKEAANAIRDLLAQVPEKWDDEVWEECSATECCHAYWLNGELYQFPTDTDVIRKMSWEAHKLAGTVRLKRKEVKPLEFEIEIDDVGFVFNKSDMPDFTKVRRFKCVEILEEPK